MSGSSNGHSGRTREAEEALRPADTRLRVRVEEGMDPTSAVEKHFRNLLDRMETYLDARKTLKIELSATFSSRGSLERSVDTTI